LIEELAGSPHSAHAPRCSSTTASCAATRRSGAGRRLRAHRRSVARRGPARSDLGQCDERCVGPGLHRIGDERAAITCGGAVALNLPRIALRAGPWREGPRARDCSSHQCTRAVNALAELAASNSARRGDRPGDLRGRAAYAIVPVGLREALAYLGDGEIRLTKARA
jgi:hypothetical protein